MSENLKLKNEQGQDLGTPEPASEHYKKFGELTARLNRFFSYLYYRDSLFNGGNLTLDTIGKIDKLNQTLDKLINI